jgi:hypothetical protein
VSKKYSVGQSKVRTWRGCRQQYHYKYEENLVRKTTRRPFAFGRLAHSVIEYEAQEEPDPIQKTIGAISLDDQVLFTAEKEMYGEILMDVATIMDDYLDYWREAGGGEDALQFVGLKDETGEMRFAEHEFEMDIDDQIVFKGQIDGFGRTPNKLKWLVENKTFDNLPGEDERWRNLQSVVYIKAAVELGLMKTIDGVCWNYIRSKAPTVPQVLKDGTRLSKREITTLPRVVLKALRDNKLDPKLEDHVHLMERAEQSRREYFQRIFTPISREVHDNIWSGFLDSAHEMLEYHGRRKDKNIGRHCGWCDYEPICRAELTGGDVDFVKDREYSKEDPEGYRRTKRRSAPLAILDQKPKKVKR